MSKLFKVIHNVSTGEIEEIDLSAEEILIIEKDQALFQLEEEAKAAAIAAKELAESKLASLGLTVEDLKALGI